jgi:hypothetical protein
LRNRLSSQAQWYLFNILKEYTHINVFAYTPFWVTSQTKETCTQMEKTTHLEDYLQVWANNIESKKNKWMNELNDKDVSSMKDLEILARGDRWESFLSKINSDILAQYLQDWRNEKYPEYLSKKVKIYPVHVYTRLRAPSTFGDCSKKEGSWIHSQQDSDTKIMCLRPSGFEGVHVSLMCPVFYEIGNVLDSGEPNSLDWHISAELAGIMGNSYKEENERLYAVRIILAKLFKMDADGIDYGSIPVRKITGRNSNTDWTVCFQESMILNLEIKNEKGSDGADAYMENVGYYVHFHAERGGPTRHCCGYMYMTVMEYVEGEEWYSLSHSSKYWNVLNQVIQLYHEAGFVHGDLRAPNIIISNQKPVILDFDWAGENGIVRYPRVLNHHDILWPDGVDVNQPIQAEHDIFMLNQLKRDL